LIHHLFGHYTRLFPVVRLKSGCNKFFPNGEGDDGSANSALLYYDPKLSLESFNNVIGLVDSGKNFFSMKNKG
jgi:hypothetical protein